VSGRCVVFGESKPAELVHKEKSMLNKFDLIKIKKGLNVKKIHTEVYEYLFIPYSLHGAESLLRS
jgi:hypothetical protein